MLFFLKTVIRAEENDNNYKHDVADDVGEDEGRG
jgi:hypothetical protein